MVQDLQHRDAGRAARLPVVARPLGTRRRGVTHHERPAMVSGIGIQSALFVDEGERGVGRVDTTNRREETRVLHLRLDHDVGPGARVCGMDPILSGSP